ncbi:MAG: class I SAM-dependent methyltransferase [Bacteroidota bacterium]
MNAKIEDVQNFWENNPLFTGESQFEANSRAFFEEHRKVYLEDVFAGKFEDNKFIPNLENKVCLDLGCGVGFWTVEIQKRRKTGEFFSADLTKAAIDATKKRLDFYDLHSHLSQQNAEKLNFETACFDFVNCQGVIHHTVNPNKAIEEIARVLKKGGEASISVYYKNFFLRNWKSFGKIGKLLSKRGAKLEGRGREDIFKEDNTDEITRLYDGKDNPIGISYSKRELFDALTPYFEIERTFLYFFPARSLPFKIPKFFHRILAKYFGFMIHANLIKK